MADIANLQFRAETGEIKSAYGDLDRLAQAAARTEKAADGLGKAVSNVGKGGSSGLKIARKDLDDLLNKINPTSKAIEELNAQQQKLNTARRAGQIGADSYATFTSILERQRDALNKTFDNLTGYNDFLKKNAATQKEAAAARLADVAALDRLRGALNPAAEASKKLQEQFTLLNRARLSGTIGSTEYVQLKKQLVDLNGVAKEAALSAGQLRQGWMTAGYQLKDVLTSLASGINPLTIAAQQLPTLALSFGSLGATMTAFAGLLNPITIGITALVAGIGYLGYEAYQSSTQMDSLQKALNGTGAVSGATARQLKEMAEALAESTDNSETTAVKAVAIATALGGTTDQIKQFAEAALVLSKSTGDGVEEILGQFKRLAADPVQALLTLNEQYNFANTALYEQVKALSDAGDKTAAMTLVVDSLEKSTKAMGQTTQTQVSNATGFWNNLAMSIGSAWDRLRQYNAENSKTAYKGVGGSAGSTGFSDKYDPYGVKKQADQSKNSWDNLNATIGNTLGFMQKTTAEAKQFKKESLEAAAQIDALAKSARTNAQIRNEETEKYKKLLKEEKINQEQYNKAIDALNEKYKDPKTRKAREASVKVDAGDKLTEQYQAQNLALDAQIEALKNRSAFEQNASTQRKAYLELEAKYTVLEQAATTRKLTKQEQQTLAVKDEALAQARLLADKGDQLLSLQKQAQVQDEISKLSATQTLSAEVYAQHQGESTKQMQRQLELAQARAAVLAKGGTQSQADQVVALKQVDYATEDARAQDYINGMKTGLADWADAASNYAKIAADAMSSAMNKASSAVSDFVTTGKFDFADFTKSILKMIVDIITQLLVMNALKAGASALGFGGLFANAKGGVYNDPSLHSYANGVYTTPQMFQFSGRSQFANGGVFAEAGPEAIMPLSRDANGRLGVKAEGGGGTGIVINQSNTVQSNGSGSSETSSTGGAVGRALGDQMQAAAQQVLQTALKPGGILYRYSNNR